MLSTSNRRLLSTSPSCSWFWDRTSSSLFGFTGNLLHPEFPPRMSPLARHVLLSPILEPEQNRRGSDRKPKPGAGQALWSYTVPGPAGLVQGSVLTFAQVSSLGVWNPSASTRFLEAPMRGTSSDSGQRASLLGVAYLAVKKRSSLKK